MTFTTKYIHYCFEQWGNEAASSPRVPKQCFGPSSFFDHTNFTPVQPQSAPGGAPKHDTSRPPHLTWGQHFWEQSKSTPQNNHVPDPGISPSLPADSTKTAQAVRQPACCTSSPIQGKGKGASLLGEIKWEIATRTLRGSCDNTEQSQLNIQLNHATSPVQKLTLWGHSRE